MKRMIILLVMLAPLLVCGQDQDRKALKKKEKEQAEAKVRDMVTNQEWVLEVTELRDKDQRHAFLSTPNNFVVASDGVGILQLNFSGIPGLNDIGYKGNIENYQIHGSGEKMYATGTINTPKGAFTFVLYPSIYNAKVVLSGAFNDTLTLFGKLISPEDTILQDRINVY